MAESSGGARPAAWRPGGTLVPLQLWAREHGSKQSAVSSFTERLDRQGPVFLFFLFPPMEGRFRRVDARLSCTNLRASLEGDRTAPQGVSSKKINKRFVRLWNENHTLPACTTGGAL